jgi:MFS family permease
MISDRARLLAVLLASPFMAQADATIANVATPAIHAGLGASGGELELVIGGYMIAFAVLVITGARLGQMHGYRRAFLAGVTVFGAASLLCGLAPGPVVLIGARVIQGAGAALMFPQALTGIQVALPVEDRAWAVGLYALALSAGAVTGQLAGGALVSLDLLGLGWRAIFLVNVPVAALVLAAGARRLPGDEPRASRALDVRGVATLSLSLLLVVLPLVLGRTDGWPAWTWLCLAASAPAFALFVAVQRRLAARGGAPLLNGRVLAHPPVYWALGALFAATGTYYAMLFTLAQYLQQGLGRSALASGLTLVPWIAAFGLGGQLVRRLPAHAGARAAFPGCLLLAAAFASLSAALLAGHHDAVLLMLALGVGGLGHGTQFSALIAHVTRSVPARFASDISGVGATVPQIGGALGVAVFGTVYLGLAAPAGAGRATHAFAIVTAAFAAAALLAAVAAYRSTRYTRASHGASVSGA